MSAGLHARQPRPASAPHPASASCPTHAGAGLLVLPAVLGALVLLCALQAAPAAAQSDWPSRPVRIVVGFPAGITDNLARLLAKVMAQQTGQSFYVENKPGAGTTIAAAEVARAAPDGYTLFMQDTSSHAINATVYRKLPYDSVRDFTAVSLVASTPLVMVVHPAVQVRSVQELVAMLKARPGVYDYGSAGVGTTSHLTGELFQLSTGTKMVHVPYKGGAAATAAMLGGEVAMSFATTSTAVPLVQAGKLRALAVTTARRAGALPDVPALQEAGVPGFDLVLYTGLLAPARLPPEVVGRVRGQLFRALEAPEVRAFYTSVGADVLTSGSPEEFTALIAANIERFGAAVRAAGVQAN